MMLIEEKKISGLFVLDDLMSMLAGLKEIYKNI